MSKPKYTIYTDGSCKHNPGPGGWAALIRAGSNENLIKGGELNTTNNRMEMLAVINALDRLEDNSLVVLFSDSKYVVDGITMWLPKWKRQNWLTSKKDAVKNSDLWRVLDQHNQRMRIAWNWVKAHSGVTENETVDQAAQQCAEELQRSAGASS